MSRYLFCIVCALLSVIPAIAWADEPQRVLLLHSFGPQFSPFSSFSRQFRIDLVSRSPKPLDIYEVSLETARFGETDPKDPLVPYLTALVADRPPDAIVAIGGPAVRFVQTHRDQLFPSTPILMTAFEERMVQAGTLTHGDAAVALRLNLPAAIENILLLRPQTRSVFVVIGRSPVEKFWKGEAAASFEQFRDRLTFEWSDALSFDQIVDRTATLPRDAVVLFGLLIIDAEGVPHEQDYALEKLRERSSVPMFGLFDSQLGKGIVGGPLVPLDELSSQAANAALRMLAGARADTIEPITASVDSPMFDQRELERWGIPEKNLPSGSVMLYHDPSFWQQYRWQITAIMAFILAESALLVALLKQRRRLARSRSVLSETQQRLTAAARAAGIGLWAWEIQNNEVWLSESGKALFGWPESRELNFDVFIEAVHSSDRIAVRGAVEQALAGHGDLDIEYRLSGPDHVRWFASRAQVEFNHDGAPLRMRGVTIDITERREAVAAARELNGRLINVHEEERSRLARELHDDVTQRLALLAINAGREARPSAMQEIRQELVRLSEDVHSLSYRLHPSILEDLGLKEGLQVECDQFAELERIPVELDAEDVPEALSGEAALCLFRITQEALRNVGRHAGASRVRVSLFRNGTRLQLSVEDDGGGFDASVARTRPSLGLASMRQRVDLVGGNIEIESTKGRGTTVLASIPLPEAEHEAAALAVG